MDQNGGTKVSQKTEPDLDSGSKSSISLQLNPLTNPCAYGSPTPSNVPLSPHSPSCSLLTQDHCVTYFLDGTFCSYKSFCLCIYLFII